MPLFKPLQHYHHIYGEKQPIQSISKLDLMENASKPNTIPQVPIICTPSISYSLDLLCWAHCPLQACHAEGRQLMLMPSLG